jgi:hypothetical protein
MTKLLLDKFGDTHDIRVTFANTGEEDERTLRFVHMCDEVFGFKTVWLEAVVHPGAGVGTTHRVVTYATASRKGEPYEEVIRKYGVPNVVFQPCNRELKLRPMRSYLRSIGWGPGSYDTAIGIREDEPRRVKASASAERIIYPLVDMFPTDKQDVNEWWKQQPFQLGLQEHEGNCKWCWKKSLSKHMRLISERPEIYDFPRRMEEQHGFSGARTNDGKPRVFFRGNRSTNDLFRLHQELKDGQAPTPSDADRDAGCSESCEVFETEAST